jgi:hypothetical protein
METPPTYAPPRKSNTGLIIGLVLGGIAICCIGGVAILGFAGFSFFKNTVAPMAECMIGYESVSESLQEYANAHGGKLPSATAWQDELRPFVEKRLAKVREEKVPFKIMDPSGEWSCTMGDRKTGMAYNSDVAGKTLEEARKANTVVIFEVDQIGKNLNIKYVDRGKEGSPKIMGESRGWIAIHAQSGVEMGDQEMGGNFRIESK